MKLTQQEKQLLEKYAKIVECPWFEFAIDDYGNDCVFDKEENKKIELCEGIKLLEWYNGDIEDVFLFEHCKIIQEQGNIYVFNSLTETKSKANKSVREFYQKYGDNANELFSNEEKHACIELFSRARRHRKLNRDRLEDLLKKCVVELEKKQNTTFIESEINQKIGLSKMEYRMLMDN
ncbi:MAG: hypothetical protein IJA69_00390 [Clostridia bacterium]|nr:hypothetical protein [Clostridia bacterium]